jgi:hypothetical protein
MAYRPEIPLTGNLCPLPLWKVQQQTLLRRDAHTGQFRRYGDIRYTPYLKKARKIEGPELSLTDCEKLCVGAGFCDRDAGTWTLVENSNNPEAKKIAIEEGQNCPSGRLVVWEKQGDPQEPKFEPSIGLMEDPATGIEGPILVRGGIPIESADGTVYEKRNRVTLCRCGKSDNKPFCDGRHKV